MDHRESKNLPVKLNKMTFKWFDEEGAALLRIQMTTTRNLNGFQENGVALLTELLLTNQQSSPKRVPAELPREQLRQQLKHPKELSRCLKG